MSASKDHTTGNPQDPSNPEHDAVLRELEGLGTDGALLREWKARLKDKAAGHPDAAQSDRLRQAILQRTVEDTVRSGPLPAEPVALLRPRAGRRIPLPRSRKPDPQPTRLWRPLAAAAVLGAVLIGAWFALRPQAGPECQNLACMLDALTAEELLDLHAQTTASDQLLDDADWAFAAGAFAEGEPDDGSAGYGPGTEPANTPEGGAAADADAPIDLDATDLEQLEWDAMPLDDAALDALEEALLGS